MKELSFDKLRHYCERADYKGWDPYDGLNSKIFNGLPIFKNYAIFRLLMIQLFKRCPINMRNLFFVPKEHNAKGIGLFLQGYCNLYNINPSDELKIRIEYLADLLLEMRSKGYSGACWGYNFDWQARRLFLFPKNTPTVVATNFCATALMAAYEVTKRKEYLNVALSSAEFIINDLRRTYYKNGFLFSYSPLKGNDTVYNASLLGSRVLSYCYKYTKNEEYKTLAEQSIKVCCEGQREDGAWIYGLLPVQSWIDSFHTGYNLDALIAYQEETGDNKYKNHITKGFNYYIKNFFENDGTPKYYNNKVYPIDIHCPGQLFVTLDRLHKFKEYEGLAMKVFNWTLKNMQDPEGYFYYQLKPILSSKISYMRWSNAFMFYSLSYYLKNN